MTWEEEKSSAFIVPNVTVFTGKQQTLKHTLHKNKKKKKIKWKETVFTGKQEHIKFFKKLQIPSFF